MFKKMNRMFNKLFLMNNKGFADGDSSEETPEDDKSFGEAIVEELDKQEAEGTEATDSGLSEEEKAAAAKATADAAAAAAEDLVDVEGYKGANRRAKGYEGDKRRQLDKDAEDPLHEMDFELVEGEGKKKFKLSELRDTAKYLHDNRNTLAASLKIRELATKSPDFAKLMNSVIKGSFNEKEEVNPEFITKTQAALDAKADAVEEKIDDTDEDIKAAEELLDSDEIDPDSVQAQVLKKNIAAMKASKNQLTKALAKIDDISSKFEKVEKSQQTFMSDQENADANKEIDRISGLFNKEFNSIVDPKKEGGFKFVDDEERNDYEAKVRDVVSKGSEGIKNDEEFVKLVKASSQAVYDRLKQVRENAVNDYIRSKGGKITKDGDAPKDTAVSVENMEKQLAALEKDGKKDSPEAVTLRKAIEAQKALDEDPLQGKSIGETIADAMFADAPKT